MPLTKVDVLKNQTLIDLAIQELGEGDKVVDLAVLNNRSITDDLEAKEQILVGDYELSKRRIVALFRNPANRPASAIIYTAAEKPEGIGYWTIGLDFIVN